PDRTPRLHALPRGVARPDACLPGRPAILAARPQRYGPCRGRHHSGPLAAVTAAAPDPPPAPAACRSAWRQSGGSGATFAAQSGQSSPVPPESVLPVAHVVNQILARHVEELVALERTDGVIGRISLAQNGALIYDVSNPV